MAEPHVNWWTHLFPAPDNAADVPSQFSYVLSKRGRPFLILPQAAELARQGLELYPAQRFIARSARSALSTLLRLGLRLPVARTRLPLPKRAPLARFLASVAGSREDREGSEESSSPLRPSSPSRDTRFSKNCLPVAAPRQSADTQSTPAVAILAGNPRTTGRRFILLVFRPDGRPAAVVKVGCGAEARSSIEHEERFLRATPTGLPGRPRLLGNFTTDALRAITLSYAEGRSPSCDDLAGAEKLLQAWVNPQEQVVLPDTASWQRLADVCGERASAVPPEDSSHPALFRELSTALASRRFAKVIAHGDFVPWNLRVHPRTRLWTALDWERGETPGVPGWDWFHFVIQTGILAKRLPTARLHRRVETLLDTFEFRNYAQRTGITGVERPLVLAYLLHMVAVIRPSEGLPKTQKLLQHLTQSWPTSRGAFALRRLQVLSQTRE